MSFSIFLQYNQLQTIQSLIQKFLKLYCSHHDLPKKILSYSDLEFLKNYTSSDKLFTNEKKINWRNSYTFFYLFSVKLIQTKNNHPSNDERWSQFQHPYSTKWIFYQRNPLIKSINFFGILELIWSCQDSSHFVCHSDSVVVVVMSYLEEFYEFYLWLNIFRMSRQLLILIMIFLSDLSNCSSDYNSWS